MIVSPKDKEEHMIADQLTLRNNFTVLETLEEMRTDESQQGNPGKRQRMHEDNRCARITTRCVFCVSV